MKKILVISRRDKRPSYDTADSMAKQLGAVVGDLVYEACFLDELEFVYDGTELTIANTRNSQNLNAYDAIFCLGWFNEKLYEEIVLGCALYAEKHGITLINSEARINRSKSKLSQYVLAAEHSLAMTRFCFAMNHDVLQAAVAKSGISYPFIMKAPLGARGNDNYLVESQKQLHSIFADNPNTPYIIQEFVPNNGDLRLLVAGGQVRMAIGRKAAEGTHLNNTSKGGSAEIIPVESLPQAMLTQAVHIAKLLNREVTGVDMIVHRDSGDFYFLEANNMPQLSTGSFVDEKAAMLNGYFESLVSTDT